MKRIEPWKIWLFIGSLAVTAAVINSVFSLIRQPRPGPVIPPQVIWRPPPVSVATASTVQPGQQTPAQSQQDTPHPRQKTPEELAAEHQKYLARYLNAGRPEGPDTGSIAIAIVAEDGKFNRSVANALADRCKSERLNPLTSFLTPEFVSDGLFTKAVNGSTADLDSLDLARSLDALLLGRQTVQYSTNPDLQNVITATMRLEVAGLPTGRRGEPKSWTFTANGAGFKQAEARALAEERLLKQIAAANMSLSRIASNTQ